MIGSDRENHLLLQEEHSPSSDPKVDVNHRMALQRSLALEVALTGVES